MSLRLNVVDGGDRGQSFALPPAGTIRIGNYGGHTEICLHDLYVAKDHCHVEIADDGKVSLTAQPSAAGTLVNGVKVYKQDLKLGDVIRVGNSYLKLEEEASKDTEPDVDLQAAAEDETAEQQVPADSSELPFLPADRLRELTKHTLSHYLVGPALAPGPVGTVFRAKDLNTGQEVALKVLPTDFPADDDEVRRFIQVMRQFLPLQHAGLVQIRGAGKTGPYVWVASDLVPGESLAVTIRDPRSKQKGKWRTVLQEARHLARTLDFLHRRHLIHGSVTPANLLLRATDGTPVLKDAGLWDALAGSQLLQYAVGKRLLAELPYLAPEHVHPEWTVDDLSDQYCLGAVVYALLTGRPPCEGASPEETVEFILRAIPLRPREACPGLPDAFQAVVLRMLAKHPEERYSGPGELLADLDKVAAKFGEGE